MSLRLLQVHWLLAGLFIISLGCNRPATESEAELKPTAKGNVRLSCEAQQSIGLETAQVRQQLVRDAISTTGWLMSKPGNEVVVKAMATGFVVPGDEATKAELGTTVADHQELGKLHIFLSPQEEAQIVAIKEDADILIEQTLASLAIAEDRYERVKKIDGGTLAGNDLQALREVVERSKATVQEARDKLPFLPLEPYERPLRLNDVAIEAPLAGRITELHVRPGQLVVQGDPLWTVADWSTLWLKVPVFEGSLAKVDQAKAIEVILPGTKLALQARATGIARPTEDRRRSVDLLYEIENQDLQLRPGQPVSVAIPTGESSDRIVIPSSALLWDGMGNSWVYVRQNADTFRRQRVQVGTFLDGTATIERGLDEQQEIVVVGAEALYGEEFQSQLEVEGND